MESLQQVRNGQFKNRLKEAVDKSPDLDWEADFLSKARGNALYERMLREGLLSDMSQALGVVHDVAIEAAKNIAVAPDIIWTMPVTKALRRFFLATRGKVWRISEGPPTQSPERCSKVDITLDYEWGYDALFSQSYIEDMPLPVLERAVADASQLLEEQLTTDIIALYDAISAGDLAGGAVVDTAASGTLAWADIVNAWQTLTIAGYAEGRKVILVHPYEFADLWKDEKFIHSFYFGDMADVRRGVLGDTYFGGRVVSTNLMALDAGGGNGNYAYVINLDKAAVCTMRRDITSQPYEEKLYQGAVVTRRYGLGTMRKDAVCRIDIVHA